MKRSLFRPQCRGFTLIELLVVIAVIAIIAAIIFPVFAKVREKARQIACVSNEKQLGIAIAQYVADNNDSMPWSYSDDTNVTWNVLVDPYVKDFAVPGGVFTCPDSETTGASYSTNSQVIGLLNVGGGPPSPNYYQSVVALSQIDADSSIVLLGEGILSKIPDPPEPFLAPRSSAEYAVPHPATVTDHTSDSGQKHDWAGPWLGIVANNKQVAWRHAGGANFIYCDGHAKFAVQGTVTDQNWDVRCQYGKACTGASTPTVIYPAPNGTCGTQSPIDCQ